MRQAFCLRHGVVGKAYHMLVTEQVQNSCRSLPVSATLKGGRALPVMTWPACSTLALDLAGPARQGRCRARQRHLCSAALNCDTLGLHVHGLRLPVYTGMRYCSWQCGFCALTRTCCCCGIFHLLIDGDYHAYHGYDHLPDLKWVHQHQLKHWWGSRDICCCNTLTVSRLCN